jgi:alanine racemase
VSSANFYERSWVEIDLDAFRANLQALKAFMEPGQGFIQIVKADAYGHGALQISQVALSEGALGLGVANPEEGKLLRIQGVKAPILILSPCLAREIPGILEYELWPTLNDLDFAKKLDAACAEKGVRLQVGLKVDSGMHRSGALEEEFGGLWNGLQKLPHLVLQNVFSHLASAESDLPFSQKQEKAFTAMLEKYKVQAPWLHLANSSALVNGLGKSYSPTRLGIMSYGVYTHPDQREKIKLKPVMSFKSAVAQIKRIPAGASVGYNRSWTASRDTSYAVIPVGYADGYDFLLSNRGNVALNGKACPVIGRVSMDMICVDITDAGELKIGDEAVLLGGKLDELRAENLAQSYQGSSYELLCQVGRRARRHYLEGGIQVASSPLSRRDFVSSDYQDSQLNRIIQAAISQRVNSHELGELISREILREFFFAKDRDIQYRHDFRYHIQFSDSGEPDHWQAKNNLSFHKVLQNDYFTVACANSEAALKSYFKRRDVEYRWLTDGNFQLNPQAFQLVSVKVDGIKLETQLSFQNSSMEIRCSHPRLKELLGREVSFEIGALALYPKSSHQLGVFITELTHGVKIRFDHPQSLGKVECVPIFAGQNKYPQVSHTQGSISVSTKDEEWVFPQSGVVFAY